MFSIKLIIILPFLIGTAYSIKCYTTDSPLEAERCEADYLCYQISGKNSAQGNCKMLRGCLQESFGFEKEYFLQGLIKALAIESPSSFSTCGTSNCNNHTANCNPKNLMEENAMLEERIKKLEMNLMEENAMLEERIKKLEMKNVILKEMPKDSGSGNGELIAAVFILVIIVLVLVVILGFKHVKNAFRDASSVDPEASVPKPTPFNMTINTDNPAAAIPLLSRNKTKVVAKYEVITGEC